MTDRRQGPLAGVRVVEIAGTGAAPFAAMVLADMGAALIRVGGGAMVLAFGIVCALLERERSGEGQVVDAAMVDGAALLATAFHTYAGFGVQEQRGANHLDGGAPFYHVYETADGKHVAVGAI